LNAIHTKQNFAFVQGATDGVDIDAIAGHEMAGSERDEPGLFIHLAEHIIGTNAPQFAHMEQPNLHSAISQGHPWVNVGRIIVEVNDNVVALFEWQSGGDETQAKGRGADEGDFFRERAKELSRERFRFAHESHKHEQLLILPSGELGVLDDGLGYAAGQW
jgi:hypothetical protein